MSVVKDQVMKVKDQVVEVRETIVCEGLLGAGLILEDVELI